MKKINLFDVNERRLEVYLVRFFRYNNDKYFIYTLNEQDQQEYVKLYLVKVIEDFGRCISYHISDMEEWQNTQSLLKTMLSELKYNTERTFEDLDPNILNGIRIEKTRVFKFKKDLVDLLSGEDSMKVERKTMSTSISEQNMSFEECAKKLKDAEAEIDRLNQIMGELLAENIRYQTKYGKLD